MVAVVEDFDGLPLDNILGEQKQCHIGPAPRTINCEKAKTASFDAKCLMITKSHQLINPF